MFFFSLYLTFLYIQRSVFLIQRFMFLIQRFVFHYEKKNINNRLQWAIGE